MTLLTRQTLKGRCPCGAQHAACGPPSTSLPVDQQFEEVAAVSGPLKRYRYTSPHGVETIVKLSARDAEHHGLTDDDLADGTKAVVSSPNKARTAENKGRAPRGKGGAGGGD